MEYVFLDIQGFKINNCFHAKEICIQSKNQTFHDVVRASFEFRILTKEEKKSVLWLTTNHHGIQWENGRLNEIEAQNIIRMFVHGKLVLVKGEEKVKWIKELIPNTDFICINIEKLGFSEKLIKNCADCTEHSIQNSHCAKDHVQQMKFWFKSSVFVNKNILT